MDGVRRSAEVMQTPPPRFTSKLLSFTWVNMYDSSWPPPPSSTESAMLRLALRSHRISPFISSGWLASLVTGFILNSLV